MLKEKEMPKVKIVLDDGKGEVKEIEGQGLIFALVSFTEEEKNIRVGIQTGIYGL